MKLLLSQNSGAGQRWGQVLLVYLLQIVLFGTFSMAIDTPKTSDESADRPRAMSADAAFGAYEIKAGFIYRFISFVSWPEDRTGKGTITIGILGPNPFGDAFDAIDGSKVGDDVVRVKYFDYGVDLRQLKTCQLLYIVGSQERAMQQVLRSMAESPTLTISDHPRFVDQGGMIGFVVQADDRMGIEMNAAVASRAGLTIRSMLKRIALRVIDTDDEDHAER